MKAADIYTLLEAQQELFEVEMSPSNLKKLASAIPGVKVGMEFEMVVPDVEDEDADYEREPDYDRDERVDDIEDIVRFFGEEDEYMGQMNSPGTLDRLRDELNDKFYEWRSEKIIDEWRDTEGREFFAKWVKENVDPDEVAEEAETPEDLFGNKEPTAEDYKKFIENQWETEGSYYDEAFDEFREDRESYGDYDESSFLSDIGIRYMSHVENNVSMALDWPYYEEPYSSGNESIESVGEDFSDAIGKRVHTSTSYHGARRSPDAYSLEPDSSIDTDSGEAGLEFISHPMPIDEMLEDLKKVKKWADRKGAYTNDSTGLHINVSVPDFSIDKLDYVKLAVLLGDKYVLDQFDRLTNYYAKSALDIIKDRAKDNEDVDRLLKQLKTNVEGIASKILHSGRTDKYTSINTKDKYVEFRSAGGDWLNQNFNKIENTLLRYVVALDAACDPNKYKKEYQKALYKLLKPKDEKSDMSMFARYMSGEITRSEYVNSLESSRKERFRSQGIKILQKDEVDENDWEVTYDDGKKKDTIYIANTDTVPNDEAAFNAAKKFKPQWFRPDTIEYISVKPFKFGEELDDLKLYRADYSHKYTSVVAENEEWAREYVMLMDPDYFSAYPDTEITLHDENATKRQINQMADWQTPRVQRGLEWLQRPKIWTLRARDLPSGEYRYYIAAVKRKDAIDVINKLEGQDVEKLGINLDLSVNDPYPSQDTYDDYLKAQNDLIQQREQERARLAAQQAEDEALDTSHLKVFRVSNMNGYRYIAAENGGEAAEIASKIDPQLSNIETLTVQDASSLSTTSSPSLIRSMFITQRNQLQDAGYGTSAQQSAPKFEVNDRVEVASGYPSLIGMKGKVVQVSPNFDFVSVLIDGNTAPSSFPTTALKKAEETTPARISDMRSYRVQNVDTGESRYFAGTDMQDAINRARQEYPAMFPRDAGLYATPAS